MHSVEPEKPMHTPGTSTILPRRAFLGAALVSAAGLGLVSCATTSVPPSPTEVVRRLLLLSSERAFVRLTEPGGYWDQQISSVGLGEMLGARGDVLSRVLTSALFKQRLEEVVADAAVDASHRVAPLVTDAVRVIGISNALALVRGGPSAATTYLRGEIGGQLVEALLPEVGRGMRIVQDPLLAELVAGLSGVDPAGFARSLSAQIEDVIWREIGVEEAAIRADPSRTRDPVLVGVFAASAAF